MTTGAPRQPDWMAHAWAELGQREIAGRPTNPRIAAYFDRVGHGNVDDDETPWCAAFVGACLERAGIASTGSLRARSYLTWGEAVDCDSPGALAVLTRGNNPAAGHVGFLVGASGDSVFLLGGNQSNAVTVARFERSRLIGLRRPQPTTAAPPSRQPGAAGFSWSLSRVLAFEGGWSEDPYDPGGPTNKGITLGVYARERGETVTAETVARLKSELRVIGNDVVERIYLQRYWRPARCEKLPPALAHFHFDASVNQGLTGAARLLQEALGVAIDGEIGPVTLGAALSQPIDVVLARYAAARRHHYRSLGHFWRFGRGWLNRVDAALEQARTLSASPPARSVAETSAPTLTPDRKDQSTMASDPIADFETTRLPPSPQGTPAKWWGQSLTIWGVAISAFTTVLPTLLGVFGLEASPELVERLGNETLALFQAIGGLLGTVMAIGGRARARTPLARRPIQVRL